MRENVRAFVEAAAAAFDLAGPVYEFGSYLVEGQERLANLRPLFPGRRYVGCDLRHGPGVDRVEDLARLSLPDGCAETIVCVDTLEHVFEARRAVDELIRVLAPGGVLLLAAPFDFRVHEYPCDYWRLTPGCVARLLAPLPATIVGWQGLESDPHTVLGVGCKTPVGAKFLRGASRFVAGYQAWLSQQEVRLGWRRRWKRRLSGIVRGKGERRRERARHSASFLVDLPADRVASWGGVASSSAQAGGRIDLLAQA